MTAMRPIVQISLDLTDVDEALSTAEMALLFTFVLFGAHLIWSGFTVLSWPVALFSLVALLIRPVAFLISLTGTRLDFRSRMLIAWFGPRGLSSLLLVLVPVFAVVPDAELLFFICSGFRCCWLFLPLTLLFCWARKK